MKAKKIQVQCIEDILGLQISKQTYVVGITHEGQFTPIDWFNNLHDAQRLVEDQDIADLKIRKHTDVYGGFMCI